jgi:chromate reductase, NAD(P)H dehydrogenase (quinone)
MNKIINILGLAGSLRMGSYNRDLLRAAQEVCPEEANIEIFDLSKIPIFNQDFEMSLPDEVKMLKQKISEANAILFATPEHNYSVPGMLKNAIDWASRPFGDNAFQGKPAAIMSASTGMLGGARAQYHLRQIFVTLDIHPVNKPEVFVSFASGKFDQSGRLTDDKARDVIKDLLKALINKTKKTAGFSK